MPISSSTPIDFAKIATEMRPTVARWYNADVEIIEPNIEEFDWDEVTNEYDGGNPEVIVWSGKARIQPLRTTSTPDLVVEEGAIRGIRIQVPYDANISLVRKGMWVRVTSGGEDTILEELGFVVKSAINSSYGWNRTIECEVDVKSVSYGGGS